jgi:anti-sigma B factor antagonist
MVSIESSTCECGGQVVVALRGELDVSDAASVAASLAAVAASGRPVILDLAALDFIDSSGLAALVRARRQALEAGCDVLLAAPQQQVLGVLALTRLIDVFRVYTGVDEAVGGLCAGALKWYGKADAPDPGKRARVISRSP